MVELSAAAGIGGDDAAGVRLEHGLVSLNGDGDGAELDGVHEVGLGGGERLEAGEGSGVLGAVRAATSGGDAAVAGRACMYDARMYVRKYICMYVRMYVCKNFKYVCP